MTASQDEIVALAAGASTGIIADVILFPLDFLKTHAQGKTPSSATAAAPPAANSVARGLIGRADGASGSVASSGHTSALPQSKSPTPCKSLDAVRQCGRPSGLSACYRGIAALAMGSMPSSAGFFLVYEVAKVKLKSLDSCSSHTMTHILAAAVAEASACVIRNPFEVVKQQVQLGLYESTPEGFAAVWRHGGTRGFFVGMGASMLRDVPFAALQLSIWEWMKLKTLGESPPHTRFSTVVSGAAGMVSGAIAALVTTPMDVAKTRLMTQKPGTQQYRGLCHCLRIMLRNEGISSLFLGVKMRCLWVALGGGIFLGGYDAFKACYGQLFERYNLFEKRPCGDCSQLVGISQPSCELASRSPDAPN
ncbi:S-adenosylmethionine mitochondrial carrier protein [Cyclospora cayetanensis]|uniref:S-adenosylmethionine mitochondrial carrier protein n=1 Tax=Cyclospora cayetanensis TaxID=88456 RepID=A0A6P5WE26_9EIME|nr:S-adenosylmethionine mitochondrial carrier protein [Cyclospora cayetanensis]